MVNEDYKNMSIEELVILKERVGWTLYEVDNVLKEKIYEKIHNGNRKKRN